MLGCRLPRSFSILKPHIIALTSFYLQLSKRRNVQQTGGDDDFALDLSAGGAMNSEVSSTTGAGSIGSVITPELIEALYSDSMEVILQATERFRKLLSKGLYTLL